MSQYILHLLKAIVVAIHIHAHYRYVLEAKRHLCVSVCVRAYVCRIPLPLSLSLSVCMHIAIHIHTNYIGMSLNPSGIHTSATPSQSSSNVPTPPVVVCTRGSTRKEGCVGGGNEVEAEGKGEEIGEQHQLSLVSLSLRRNKKKDRQTKTET